MQRRNSTCAFYVHSRPHFPSAHPFYAHTHRSHVQPPPISLHPPEFNGHSMPGVGKLRLPRITYRNSRRTARWNRVRMIRIRLPCDSPITRNINILILNHCPRRKTHRHIP